MEEKFFQSLVNSQGAGLELLGRAAIEQMVFLQKIFTKKADELDPLQAAAIKEMSKAGQPSDILGLLGSLRAGSGAALDLPSLLAAFQAVKGS